MKKGIYFILAIFTVLALAKWSFQLESSTANQKNFFSPELHFDGPAKFAQYHHLIRSRENSTIPNYETGYTKTEFDKLKNGVNSRNAPIDWIERGPGNVGGRTRGIVVDPTDSTYHTWFTGSAGGGVWMTDDAGDTWKNLTTDLPNLSTTTLAISAHNPNVIYAGTGEGFGAIGMINGSGIWKSLDRGNTWEALASTTTNRKFKNVLRMIVNPDNENEIIVAGVASLRDLESSSYIMKSIDGGLTWTETYKSESSSVQQLVADPSDFNIQYAMVNRKGVFQSKDAGDTWTRVFSASAHGLSRIEMSISPVDHGYMYMACGKGKESTLFFTSDTFKTVTEAIYSGGPINWMASQSWYDNTIAAHPYDKDKVWVAGAGPMLELSLSDDSVSVIVLDKFINNTTFLKDIPTSRVYAPSDGLVKTVAFRFGQNTHTKDEDLLDVDILFGPGKGQKAHITNFDYDTRTLSYGGFTDVPFEAWDIKNNRQLLLSFIDLNGDGKWNFESYKGSNIRPDVVLIHSLDYAETENEIIRDENQVYKAQYHFFKQKPVDYEGDETDFPEGNLQFRIDTVTGFLADFDPITDGYKQYGKSTKGVHVDHHNLILIPVDDETKSFYVLNGNDGGVAFSDDNGVTFKQTGDAYNKDGDFETLSGYNVAQFYGLDKMNGEDRYVGGTQDNGSWVSPIDPADDSKWVRAPSGDGFEAAWHYDNTDLIVESSQYNHLYKSRDAGATWKEIELPESTGPFITRLASSQLDPDLLFVMSDEGIIKSTDFGDTWEIKKMPSKWQFSSIGGAPIAISLADPNVVWAGDRMTSENRIALSQNKGEKWKNTDRYVFADMGYATGIATHPLDPAIAYVLFSQSNGPKILKTTNFGNKWVDISGFKKNVDESNNGFPDVATYSLLVMPFDTSHIWVGTEIGLMESLDGGNSWAYADNGIPAVGIWQMKIVNDEIVVATHGRGIWSVNVSELGAPPVANDDLKVELDVHLKLSPNPMVDNMKIELKEADNRHVDVKLVDMNGRILRSVFSGKVQNETSWILNRDGLVSGTYLIVVEMGGDVVSEKFVVL